MDTDRIKGNWLQIKGALREKYAEITDDELEATKADQEQLEGLLMEKTGKTKDEVRHTVDELLNKF